MRSCFTDFAAIQIDLVWLWKRLDKKSTTGRNTLVRLAIHLLSVIANSAGCKRAFSTFGITHTKIRNKLSAEKVHKTAVVKMDIRRAHAQAGLLRPRQKQKFGEESPSSSSSDANDHPFARPPTITPNEHSDTDSDPTNFNEMVNGLIADSRSADNESDFDFDLPILEASSVCRNPRPAIAAITLEKLFIFPSDPSEPALFEFYWKGGVQNLEAELQAYDLLYTDSNPLAVPTAESASSS